MLENTLFVLSVGRLFKSVFHTLGVEWSDVNVWFRSRVL